MFASSRFLPSILLIVITRHTTVALQVNPLCRLSLAIAAVVVVVVVVAASVNFVKHYGNVVLGLVVTVVVTVAHGKM